MFYQKKVIGLALSIVLVTLTACGGQSSATRDRDYVGGNIGGVIDGSGADVGGTVGTVVNTLPPAIKKSFSLTGSNTSYEVTTNSNSTLSVRLKAEDGAKMALTGSNFTTNYSCASFDVSLLIQNTVTGEWTESETVRSKTLQVDGQAPCGNGVAYDDIDFSGSLSPGHGALKIKISAPRYDFLCKMYYACWQTYGAQYYAYGTACYDLMSQASYQQVCPSKSVYSTHVVKGAFQIKIDGTSFR
jgi:hypothetical protein